MSGPAIRAREHNDTEAQAAVAMRHSLDVTEGIYPVQQKFSFADLHGGVTEAKALKSVPGGRRKEVRTVAGVDLFWYLAAKFGRMVRVEADQSLPVKARKEAGQEATQLALELMPYVLPRLKQIEVTGDGTGSHSVHISIGEMAEKVISGDTIDGQSEAAPETGV